MQIIPNVLDFGQSIAPASSFLLDDVHYQPRTDSNFRLYNIYYTPQNTNRTSHFPASNFLLDEVHYQPTTAPNSVHLHDIPSQPTTLHDSNCTFHLDPISPPNCTYCEWVNGVLGIRSTSIPATLSPSQSSLSETSSASPLETDLSSSAGGSLTRSKATVPPTSPTAPSHRTFVWQSRIGRRPAPSYRVKERSVDHSSSAGASDSSLVQWTYPSSRRNPGCLCPPPPDSDWIRHWRRSCPHNTDRHYLCPRGCGKYFTRKDNAKRHAKLRNCLRLVDREHTLEQPSNTPPSSSI